MYKMRRTKQSFPPLKDNARASKLILVYSNLRDTRNPVVLLR
jgi:hypothetical protein